MTATSLDELGPRIAALMDARKVPALAAAVVEHGTITDQRAWGVSSAVSHTPATTRTVFEAASMGKPVIAALAMRLVEERRIELDHPVSAYTDAARAAFDDPRVESITVRQALTHRTGLGWDPDKNRIDFVLEPGVEFRYANEGTFIVQHLLEAVTGDSLQDLAERILFHPLGMVDSSFVWRDDYASRAATPHDHDGVPMEKGRPESAYAPSSLHTTAIDFARFIAILLAPSQVLSATSTAEMLEPQCEVHEAWGGGPPVEGSSWGLGWGLQTLGHRSAWHWGWNDGFLSFACAWPEESRAIVSFTNGMNGLWVCKELVTLVSGQVHPAFSWLEH